VSLNIKNEETHSLVRKLARLTGESQTQAVAQAVRERLDRLSRGKGEELVATLLAIGKDCAAHLTESARALDHGELLYDENGLPK